MLFIYFCPFMSILLDETSKLNEVKSVIQESITAYRQYSRVCKDSDLVLNSDLVSAANPQASDLPQANRKPQTALKTDHSNSQCSRKLKKKWTEIICISYLYQLNSQDFQKSHRNKLLFITARQVSYGQKNFLQR